MSISLTEVCFTDDTMWLTLSVGGQFGVPLVWFPRLLAASPAELTVIEISAYGLRWEALEEDISVSALLEGRNGMEAVCNPETLHG